MSHIRPALRSLTLSFGPSSRALRPLATNRPSSGPAAQLPIIGFVRGSVARGFVSPTSSSSRKLPSTSGVERRRPGTWRRWYLAAPQAKTGDGSAPAPAGYRISSLDEREYHEISDRTMDNLFEYLEILLEEAGSNKDGEECDIEYSSGVLTLRMGPSHGTYVINKQPPNKQIWFSSPVSGPFRFDYSAEHKSWFSTKEGKLNTLDGLLDRELSEMMGRKVEVNLGLEE